MAAGAAADANKARLVCSNLPQIPRMYNRLLQQAMKRRQSEQDIDDEVAAALAAYGGRGWDLRF